jgi:hypothetical protein
MIEVKSSRTPPVRNMTRRITALAESSGVVSTLSPMNGRVTMAKPKKRAKPSVNGNRSVILTVFVV